MHKRRFQDGIQTAGGREACGEGSRDPEGAGRVESELAVRVESEGVVCAEMERCDVDTVVGIQRAEGWEV
jgi:hypothetical protein